MCNVMCNVKSNVYLITASRCEAGSCEASGSQGGRTWCLSSGGKSLRMFAANFPQSVGAHRGRAGSESCLFSPRELVRRAASSVGVVHVCCRAWGAVQHSRDVALTNSSTHIDTRSIVCLHGWVLLSQCVLSWMLVSALNSPNMLIWRNRSSLASRAAVPW